MLTCNVQIEAIESEDELLLLTLMEVYRDMVNDLSAKAFNEGLFSYSELHNAFYYAIREKYPIAPSQTVIKALREVVATYQTMKSNKKPAKKAFEKRNLSLRLDKRIFSKSEDPFRVNIITTEKRKWFSMKRYARLEEFMGRYGYQDPLLFIRDGRVFLGLTFDVSVPQKEPTSVLGVDLGIRRVAACSDGRLIIDREFNREKRKLRYLKRQLQAKGSPSARKHRRKLLGTERNRNRNQTHLVANAILNTTADCIAIENLKGIKAKKHKQQNKNAISQVPLFDLRKILTYKAMNAGKSVRLVSPAYTSQDDSISGKRDGIRRGCRYYAASGKVYDADWNAAINIALRAKHPISRGGFAAPLDGQGVVNRPIAYQPSREGSIASQRLSVVGG